MPQLPSLTFPSASLCFMCSRDENTPQEVCKELSRQIPTELPAAESIVVRGFPRKALVSLPL